MTDIISSEVMTKRSICTIDLTEAFKTVNECIAPKFGDTLEFLMADVKDWYKFQSALSRYAENGNDIIYRVGVVERANDCRVKATKIIYEIAETLLEQAAAKIALNIDGCLAQIFGINLINLQIPTPCLRVEPRKAVLAKLPNSKNLKHDEPQIGGELAQAPNNGVMANDTKSADSPSIFNPMPDTSEVSASSKIENDLSESGGTSVKSQCEPIPSMACTDGLLTSTETPSGNEETQAISASDESMVKEQTENKTSGEINYSITPTEAFIGVLGDDSYFTNPFNWSRAFSQSKWEKTPDNNINEFKVQIADYANCLTPSGALSRLSCINMAHNTPEFMAYQKSAQKLLGNYSQGFTEILESENSSTLITNSDDAERTAIKTFALDRTISLRFLMRIAKLAQLRLAPYGDNHYGDSEHGKKCLKAIEVEKLSILNEESQWVDYQKIILLSYLNETLKMWWEHLNLGKPLEQAPVVLNSNNEALTA